jgi:TonB family protein
MLPPRSIFPIVVSRRFHPEAQGRVGLEYGPFNAEVLRMKHTAILLSCLLLACLRALSQSGPQDIKVREAAEHLLERANRLSTSPHLPNLERVVNFRVTANGSTKQGSVTRVVVQGTGRRDEYTYGDFHLLDVWTATQVAAVGQAFFPPELKRVLRITPIWLVHLDGEDVVHNIVDREVSGVPAHCIEFDTVRGQQAEKNEICVDTAEGKLIRLKAGGEVVENREFFPFAGAWIPGSLHYEGNGQTIEITQIMREVTNVDPNILVAPEGAEIHNMCKTSRPPFGTWMPQPPAGKGTGSADVVVRGVVGENGKMLRLAVQSSERPDLNSEALATAKEWIFSPAMCDGRPNLREVAITLHFVGR